MMKTSLAYENVGRMGKNLKMTFIRIFPEKAFKITSLDQAPVVRGLAMDNPIH